MPIGLWIVSTNGLCKFHLACVSFCGVCCCSVAKSCLTLCYPMDYSTPDFPVLHYLLEFAKTYVHWVGDAIQSSHPSVAPFSSCPQSFPASGSFPVSWLFASHGLYWSFSFSISPSMIIWGRLPLVLTGLILVRPMDSQESSPAPQVKSISSSVLSLLYGTTHMTPGKMIALTIWISVGKVMSLLFNVLSRFVIAFHSFCVNVSFMRNIKFT